MNATMMHFAIFIPDWNSLESVRRAHSDLEGAALVFFALLVLFDVLAHFSDDKRRERLFEKIGLCFFAIAVFAELLAYPYGQRNDSLSEQLIGSLDAKARQASSDASQAITDSGTALSQAKDALNKTGAAEGAMKNAANEALNARTAASSALFIARGARQEADSFETDIKSAKQQSADAESHLADALQRAVAAERELTEFKAQSAPRRLTPKQQASIASKLAFPNERADLTWFPETFEIGKFAADIEQSLRMVHWDVTNRSEPGGNGLPVISGILILTMPTDRSEEAGTQLLKALNAEGVPCSIAPITAFFPSFSTVIKDRKSLDSYASRLLVVVGNHP
jgi:hypothetical protein